MLPSLFLVESSAKARSLVDILGRKIDTLIITTAPLEVVQSPKGEKVKPDGLFLFKPTRGCEETAAKILSSLDREIFLAFDHDQRGEYWSWMISEFIRANTEGRKTPKRLHLHSLSEKEIERSLGNPVDNHNERGGALQVRTIFDHLLAKHLKRLTGSAKGRGGLSLDFSTLTFLFFLAEREGEIKRFSPVNKREIIARLSGGEGEFEARLKTAANITQDGLFKSKDEIKKALTLMAGGKYVVKSVSRVPRKIDPPLPFNTLSLVQEAYLQLKMDPEKTLKSARELFHGIKTDGLSRGLIPFFLTSETDLPEDAANVLRGYVSESQGEGPAGQHEITSEGQGLPIIPLLPHITPDQVTAALSREAADLYGIIRNRALAGQMREASGEDFKVVVQAGDECTFSVNKFSVTEKGHLAVYRSMAEKELTDDSPITGLQECQILDHVKYIVKSTSGIPPEYYSLETIFSDLADMGVHMDFMMAAILKDMLLKGYLEIAPQGTLHTKENCGRLVEIIDRTFPNMPGINLSAFFTQTVDEVTSGRKGLLHALSQFDQTLNIHGRSGMKPKAPAPEAQKPDAPMEHQQAAGKTGGQHLATPREDRGGKGKPVLVGEQRSDDKVGKVVAFGFSSMDKPRPKKEPAPDKSKVHGKVLTKPDVSKPESMAEITESHLEAPAEHGAVYTPEDIDTQREREPSANETASEVEAVEEETLLRTENEAEVAEKKSPEVTQPAEETTTPEEPAERVEGEVGSAKPPETAEAVKEIKAEKVEPAVKEELTRERIEEKEEAHPREEPDRTTEKDKVEEKYCPDCGRKMEEREDIHGKYRQCLGFPECRHTESFDRHAIKMVCPVCHTGEVITERTRIGKRFYVCSKKECEFITWYLPHAITCPECNNPFLVEKEDAKGRIILRCPRAGCRYEQSPSGDPTPASSVSGPSKKARKVRKVRVKAKGGRGKPVRKVVRKVRARAK